VCVFLSIAKYIHTCANIFWGIFKKQDGISHSLEFQACARGQRPPMLGMENLMLGIKNHMTKKIKNSLNFFKSHFSGFKIMGSKKT
jgi:hypothetical protein